ncbi:hypothetical protein J5N97_023556 [Dioscorea zingiberensis]|uniref:PHD-type domain-containing protein n=1 Tax=Dioscorea zingiberensis TaxID=325984 RepID=A0A9D5C5G1_9LILI|nr:hypothetical protein J5N97_023556 [Dioscorea zingiberensis]
MRSPSSMVSDPGMVSGRPEDFVLRSGVRSGLKREFSWALKAQAQIPTSLSRTRSGKPPAPSYSPLPVKNKKRKRSGGLDSPSLAEQIKIDELDASTKDPAPHLSGNQFRRLTRSALKGLVKPPASIDQAESGVDVPLVIEDDPKPGENQNVMTKSSTSLALEPKPEEVAGNDDLMDVDGHDGPEIPARSFPSPALEIKVDMAPSAESTLVNAVGSVKPMKTYMRLKSKLKHKGAVAPIEKVGPLMDLDEPERRFTARKTNVGIEKEDEDVSIMDAMDAVHLEYPTKRITRSATNAAVATAAMSCSQYIRKEDANVKGNGVNGSSSTPKKKMELKMSKKISITKLPSNIRELLATGLLEGFPVMYITCNELEGGLQGVIKNDGIVCSCDSCQGSKTISAYQFELHAGSTKKHPSDFIFLENGKCIHDVLKECSNCPLDMLETVIQKAIRPVTPKDSLTCRKCKGSFQSSRHVKFALLCDSCFQSQKVQSTPGSSNRVSNTGRSSRLGLVPKCSDSASKSKSSTKESSRGRLTKKDVGLHKLVFVSEILPEGTEVGYYVRGKRLLEGFIKDSGIFCRCCNTVVSPSQFEAHAGRAARRKPYNNIYTSNGVSLHELSVSLSKGRKLSASQNDDLCSICADGGDLLLCDLCPRAFHPDCVGLSSIPKGDWYCRYCHNLHQREKCLESNANAIAAGRVAGVDPIEEIFKRCIRVVKTQESDVGGCVLCRCQDYSKSGFSPRTVLLCDQCEKEYHVGCLKDHNMADLQELPEGEWFCCDDCNRIHMALQGLLIHGPEPLQDLYRDLIGKKQEESGLSNVSCVDISWRLLSGKTSSADSKPLLSKAVSILHESFDPIVDIITGRDLIPSMVYGRNLRDQDYGGMYCAVLTIGSFVVSVGILRVLGCEVAELPLVATQRENQGQGYFRLLFACIEKLLASLQVKHFVLPAADEAESIWINKFGFSKITLEKLNEYTKGAHLTIFQGTSMLHKPVPQCQGI